MTDSELLATGELCSALLISADFKTIVMMFEQSIAADILATKASDKQRREELYASLWGARELLSFMKLNADAADTIKNPQHHDPDLGTTDTQEVYDDEGFPVHERDDY